MPMSRNGTPATSFNPGAGLGRIDAALLAQPTARVPAQAFARLWMAVAQALDDEFFGLDARRMKVGTFAMLCHALAGQATVGAALPAI